VLFFIHFGARRVVVSGVTANPDSAWVTQQARNASLDRAELGLPATHLLLDHDSKFTDSFDAVFEADNTEVKRVGPVSPNMNALEERWSQSAKTKLFYNLLIIVDNDLKYVITNSAAHYNLERPHQSRGNVPLPDAEAADAGEPPILPFPKGDATCRERLAGLLKHYCRDAV
jgi:hypothetical protein